MATIVEHIVSQHLEPGLGRSACIQWQPLVASGGGDGGGGEHLKQS